MKKVESILTRQYFTKTFKEMNFISDIMFSIYAEGSIFNCSILEFICTERDQTNDYLKIFSGNNISQIESASNYCNEMPCGILYKSIINFQSSQIQLYSKWGNLINNNFFKKINEFNTKYSEKFHSLKHKYTTEKEKILKSLSLGENIFTTLAQKVSEKESQILSNKMKNDDLWLVERFYYFKVKIRIEYRMEGIIF